MNFHKNSLSIGISTITLAQKGSMVQNIGQQASDSHINNMVLLCMSLMQAQIS